MANIVVEGHLRKVLPTKSHRATIIFSHGLGQYNATWAHLVLVAFAPHFPHVLWILPQSAHRPVAMSPGQTRPAWFNVWHLPPQPHEFDEIGISESIQFIESIIIAQVSSGIDSRRIVLAGFSQGAALSLMVGLTSLYELGGIVSMSGWIPNRMREQMIHANVQLPILWCHGTRDSEIPEFYGMEACSFMRNTLRISDKMLSYRRYEGLGHTINDPELDGIISWLADVLS